MIKTTSTDKARAAWGESVPDWIIALASECDRTSQGAAGRRCRKSDGRSYSAATVNYVLGNTYAGSLGAVEASVRSYIMTTAVLCPHSGETIPHEICAERSSAPMPMSGPAALRAWQACRVCPNSRTGG